LLSSKIYLAFLGTGDWMSTETPWNSTNMAVYQAAMTNAGASSYFDAVRAFGLNAPVYHSSNNILITEYIGILTDLEKHRGYMYNVVRIFHDTEFAIGEPDLNGMYLMVISPYFSTPANLKIDGSIAFDTASGGFCGYHSSFTNWSNRRTIYGIVGTNGTLCQWHLGSNQTNPNTGFIDVTVSVMLHEIAEMMTNPTGAGWWDNSGFENGDKCVGFPSAVNYVSGTSGAVYNAILGTRKFLLQGQFNKATNTCPQLVYL
jgi:hypothetical protein